MNAITKAEQKPLSAEALEHVLGTGDLSKLSTSQRVEYYGQVCNSIGVNPLTRPFRFMTFQGQTVMYATRDLTDQLRNLRKISVAIVDKQLDGDLFIVTARATTADHRTDEDVGAVTMGQLRGDARANAIMKAMTKAKRRVTMSICGLGFLDETEVETLPGAKTYDAEAEAPVPVRQVATALPASPPPPEAPPPKRRTRRDFLNELQATLAACHTIDEVDEVAQSDDVVAAISSFTNGALDELNALLAAAIHRTQTDPDPGTADSILADAEDDFPGDK